VVVVVARQLCPPDDECSRSFSGVPAVWSVVMSAHKCSEVDISECGVRVGSMRREERVGPEQPAIGEELGAARARRGHGQREAAKAVGVTQAAWGKWERGESAPGARHLPRLAAYCELPVTELLALIRSSNGAGTAELARLRSLVARQERQIAANLARIDELTTTLLEVLRDRKASARRR
jgi:transcriptional regulator with XRE-family HTH domain